MKTLTLNRNNNQYEVIEDFINNLIELGLPQPFTVSIVDFGDSAENNYTNLNDVISAFTKLGLKFQYEVRNDGTQHIHYYILE